MEFYRPKRFGQREAAENAATRSAGPRATGGSMTYTFNRGVLRRGAQVLALPSLR